jgi:hypothetical protein
LIARLKFGVTVEQARADMAAVAHGVEGAITLIVVPMAKTQAMAQRDAVAR